MPFAVQLLAIERECEVTFAHAVARIAFGLPAATIPHAYRAAAVLAFRNDAFEICVVEGMILGANRKAAIARLEARAFRHGPRQQHAVELQSEVVVEPARSVLLDDEAIAAFRACALATGLCSDAEVAHRPILGELLVRAARHTIPPCMAGAVLALS